MGRRPLLQVRRLRAGAPAASGRTTPSTGPPSDRGVERGLRLVDWGLSDRDQPGLVAFKRKWASVERSLVTLRAGEPAAGPAQRGFGAELGELTRLLTDESVPDEITERAGAVLYRYFC